MSQFSKPKFAPNGAKTIPLPMDTSQAQLGMAIQLGDGGGGPSKLGALVRGQMPRRDPQERIAAPQRQAPAPPPPPAAATASLGAQPQRGGGVVVKVMGVTPEGDQVVDQVELTFPPGTVVQDCQQIS